MTDTAMPIKTCSIYLTLLLFITPMITEPREIGKQKHFGFSPVFGSTSHVVGFTELCNHCFHLFPCVFHIAKRKAKHFKNEENVIEKPQIFSGETQGQMQHPT